MNNVEKTSDINYKECLIEFAKEQNENARYKKDFVGAIKINDMYMLLGKERIQTKFCFEDEGPSYEFYKELVNDSEKLKAYFLDENLRKISNKIENLKSNKPAFLSQGFDKSFCLSFPKFARESYDGILVSDEDRKKILNALEFCKDEFEKRLQTYIKKYDTSKLRVWTFWANM